RRLGRFLFGKDSVNRFESVWALDFEREVLPELGPECGAVLLGVPKLTGAGLGTPSALFIQTKTDKLARAFADGTLLKGSSPSRKAVRVKLGANDYWFAVWNGFLVIAENEAAIDQLESSEHLSASRDFQKSASQARGEVIAFGGVNIEAAAAGLKLDSNDPLLSLGMTTLVSLARAFHSQSFYITLGEGGLAARMSVSLDREGRFSISDLASVSKEFQFAAAEVEAHGAPIDDQKRLDSVTLRISSKAPGAIERLKDDIESPGQVVDKRSDSELIVTIERRRPNPDLKVEIPVKSPEMEPFLKPAGDIKVGAPTVVAQAREIAGQDRAAWTVARKLADWTFKNLKWKRVDFADAAKTLATREADCLEFSELFVSMARSLGLPARIVTGLAHTGGSFGGHAWVEVWVGEWVQLDPTWGTNFVDATHIKSASSELVAYSALNAIGLEVVKTTRAIPEFQKSPTALAEALCNEFNNGDEEALAVALDPAFLVDSLMGDGAWAAMSAAERDQIYSARRRLAAELADAFSSPWKGSAGVRVLQVKQEGDRAEAAIISLGSLSRIYLGRKGESWFVRECRYEDLAYSVIEEDLRPTLLGLEAKRKNAKPPQIVDSAESRVLQARDRDARQAVQIAEAALKEAPTSKTLRYLKAVCLLQTLGEARAARQEEAVRLLDELAGEKPVFVPALRELAEHYAGADRTDPAYQSQLDKAIDLYQRYAALVPEDPRPHEAMGLIYDDAEDLVHAEAEYRKLVALDPLDPSNYSALAGALFKQSRHKEALAVIDESKGRGADREEMFANLFFELSGEPENARLTEELALAAPERLAKNFRANVNLALVRIESGRFADALPLLRRAVDLDPKSAEPHCSMANAFRKLRNWTAALKSADLAIKLDPEDPESHFHRACALAQMRRPAEAIAALKKAVELDEEMEFTEGFEKEEDLKPLASSPAFKKLVKETTAEEPPAVPRKDK
ncbi:MAG TPA: transglutaminase domain-containing protein, partial [Blastocatellia bacterium]|nr:transglutaminase domain-containing protein [Blastocatellia bacterium]